MKHYHNYSPEISSAEENQEFPAEEQPVVPEPTAPGRRRNSRRQSQQVAPKDSVGKSTSAPETERNVRKSRSLKDAVKEWRDSIVTRLVVGIILGGLGFWFAVAFLSYFSNCVIDQSMAADSATGLGTAVANDAGEGGARITELLINQGFGVGAVVIVVWLLCVSMKLLVGYPRFRTLDFTIKSLIALITLSVVVGMVSIGLDTDVNWGGFHGRYINEVIYSYIGWSGAIIISIVLISLFVVICLRDAIKWILRKKRAYDERKRKLREAEEAEMQVQGEVEEMKRREKIDQALSGEGEEILPEEKEPEAPENVEFSPDTDTLFEFNDLEDEEDPVSPYDTFEEDPNSLAISEEPLDENEYADSNMGYEAATLTSGVSAAVEESVMEDPSVGSTSVEDNPVDNTLGAEPDERAGASSVEADYIPEEGVAVPPESDILEEEDVEQKEITEEEPAEAEEVAQEDVMTVNVNQIEKGMAAVAPNNGSQLFTHEYKFPPTDYLRPGSDKISVDPDELLENKQKIKQTLLDFGIPITSIEATVGPTVTLYEIRPDTGVKIAKIRGLADDLALSLAANGVRIIAPIPGKGTVGIEVANKDAQTVSMRTIIQSKAYQTTKYKLPVALGSTISNEVYIADLAKMPHLLVAGATGQGKSVGLNAIVTSLLYSKRPEELKFVMVDPKRVEFTLYTKIEKYYLAKIPDSPQAVITKMENVVATLNSLCVEMDERYMLLEKAYVKQLTEYNDKFNAKKLDPREGHRYMPYIVVIIDEFADLIMTAGKDVELPIARLAQLARAVGIHVIIATQRPSTNVITGMIKANFPVRIAFKVSSGIDSKTILDSTGAQQLIGRGDMLISNNGEMTRVQCAFVDTPEVEEVCDYISRQPYPQGPYMLPEPQMDGDSDGQEVDAAAIGKLDPLLKDIARQVVSSGVASTSAVQRRYEIGYNRAGRIMDQLEALGVVGPATGGKPRNVLMDPMSLEDLLDTLG
ncbi:MAG: DNA translocase FtsK [Muribaculaceae bacterium]|nr:DNA translocase FtsK [Muribaculaceae bacterium]